MWNFPTRAARLRGTAAAAAVLAITGCSIFTARPVTPISEVVEASKSGADRAIERMTSTRTSYALRGSDFGKLAEAGVPDKALDHLQQTLYNEVDLLTRYWVLGESLGGCDRCYPQPVDLSTLSAGGTGMADGHDLGHRSTFAKPQGLPDWMTAFPGPANGPVITVAEAEQLVKQGKPAEEVVAQIEGSRAHDYIDHQAFTKVSTHFVAALTGSELATLHRNGVPDPVLDALQRKYLAEFIEFNRVRYQSWGKGSFPN
jgi:hypothetical protein